MKHLIFISVSLLAFVFANSQKGKNSLQGAIHYGIPVNNLADVTNGGYGGALKGLYGFSARKQQVSLSIGYTNFPVKKSLSGDFDFYYSTLPVMVGYRHVLGSMIADKGIYLESQAGINFNTIKGYSAGAGSGGPIVKKTGTDLVFALSIGYEFKGLDLSARYQSAQVRNSDNGITFVALQIGYSFLAL